MNPPMKQQRLARRIFKGFAVLAMLGVLGIATLLASLWLEHSTEVTLPTPTGAFAVGRALYDWADEETLDTLAPGPGIKRELLAWIWYPAVAGSSAAIDDYLPVPLRTAVERQSGVLLTQFLTRDRSKVHTHSLRDTDLGDYEGGRFSRSVELLGAG